MGEILYFYIRKSIVWCCRGYDTGSTDRINCNCPENSKSKQNIHTKHVISHLSLLAFSEIKNSFKFSFIKLGLFGRSNAPQSWFHWDYVNLLFWLCNEGSDFKFHSAENSKIVLADDREKTSGGLLVRSDLVRVVSTSQKQMKGPNNNQ